MPNEENYKRAESIRSKPSSFANTQKSARTNIVVISIEPYTVASIKNSHKLKSKNARASKNPPVL